MLTARLPAARVALLGFCLAGVLALPLRALEKSGMPDLAQEEQTCLPTSTANIIVWFGLHGYPKLIAPGDSRDNGYVHTIHRIMDNVDATYQQGTRTDAITYGIAKYIHDTGYGCDVEYRGVDFAQAKYPHILDDKLEDKYKAFQKTPVPFTQDWLQGNDDPSKAFLLLIEYVSFDRNTNTFRNPLAGHAVTLVNAEPDMILIHDPAHYGDEPGRKILTPEILTGGTFELPGYHAPVAGLMLLSGSLLDSPEDSLKLLTGAVCITMHPINDKATVIASAGASPTSTMGGNKGTATAPVTPASTPPASAATPASTSWGMWIFNLLFSK